MYLHCNFVPFCSTLFHLIMVVSFKSIFFLPQLALMVREGINKSIFIKACSMEQSGTIMKERIEQWTNRWHSNLQKIVPIKVLDGTKWSGTTFSEMELKIRQNFEIIFQILKLHSKSFNPFVEFPLFPPIVLTFSWFWNKTKIWQPCAERKIFIYFKIILHMYFHVHMY